MDRPHNPEMTHRLEVDGKTVVIVGTAHVSHDSVALVKSVVDAERPDTVAVELCPSRYQSIRQKTQWQEMNIVDVIKQKKAFLLLSNLMLASFQRRIAAKLNIRPGEEMLQAIDSAESIGAHVHLADRDIRTTLLRLWRRMGFWARLKLLFQLIMSLGDTGDIDEETIEQMKQQDVLETLLAEIGRTLPMVREILIDERDRYLAHNIRNAPGSHVVAVVGAGHVAGIKACWEQPVDMEALESIPPGSRLVEILKWAIPVMIVALIAAGFFYGGAETGTGMVTWWILANACLAGLGALIALAHPLTIISSVIAAPLTSLNPLIAAGWVSGLVEAFTRKPRVKDFEQLHEDILSIRGFWRNKVTKILLVVVLTNLGSTFGTFVALPMMMKLL